jgi:DNA-binding transcriptional regulator YdaS (Cro superfamily)
MPGLRRLSMVGIAVPAAVVLAVSGTAIAQNIRGSVDGPPTASGSDYPGVLTCVS